MLVKQNNRHIMLFTDKKGIKVERIYAGHLKSSLEMHGFQICVLRLVEAHADYWLKLLDASTDAPGWPGTLLSVNGNLDNISDDADVERSFSSTKMVSF